MEKKTCVHCGKTKPIAEFRYIGGGNKYRNDCKRCMYDKEAAYRRRPENRQRYIEHTKNRKPPKVRRIVSEKVCSFCGVIKPASEFSPVWHTSTGLSSNCKQCNAERRKRWYRTVTGERNAKTFAKQYVQRPAVKAKLQAKAKSPERKAYFKAHAQTEAFKRAQQKYRRTEQGRLSRTAISFRRRAKIKGNGDKLFTPKDLERLLDSKGRYCHYCGKPCMYLEIDHQLPIELGGTNAVENLWPACRSCNRAKGPRYWELGCRMKKGT